LAIQPLSPPYAADAARLHMLGINTGFLSSLGESFLRQLYIAVPACPSGFGFVSLDETGRVDGFIACAESTGTLYKQALLRRGLCMMLPLMRFCLRPAVIRRMWQTLGYPSQVSGDLPPAEVLSIAVDSSKRGGGVGKQLMHAALDEFARRGIDRVKVAVWAENLAANRFYERCGFAMAMQRTHHGLPMNIYSISIVRSGD
jgi:ribosomal protein S18 acetylase RimI-like enzyme